MQLDARKIIMTLVMVMLLPCNSLHAQDEAPWYEVEMIIFKNLNSNNTGTEEWRPPSTASLPENMVELIPEKDITNPTTAIAQSGNNNLAPLTLEQDKREKPYQILDNKTYQLNALADKLTRSGKYKILSHIAWRQPFVDAQQAPFIHLYSNMNRRIEPVVEEALANQSAQSQTSGPVPPLAGHTPVTSDNEDTFDGDIKLSVSRYLHADIDLIFQQPATEIPANNNESSLATSQPVATRRFELRQTRRMRSKTLHYIDHPLYGVFLIITPYERAEQNSPALPTKP